MTLPVPPDRRFRADCTFHGAQYSGNGPTAYDAKDDALKQIHRVTTLQPTMALNWQVRDFGATP